MAELGKLFTDWLLSSIKQLLLIDWLSSKVIGLLSLVASEVLFGDWMSLSKVNSNVTAGVSAASFSVDDDGFRSFASLFISLSSVHRNYKITVSKFQTLHLYRATL